MFHYIDITNFLSLNPLALLCFTLMIIISYRLISKPTSKVFLLDFACYKPPVNQAISKEDTLDIAKRNSNYTKETFQFMNEAMAKSGLGDSTYLPPSILKDPADFSFEGGKKDVEAAIFGAVDALLAKTKLKSDDIGILVVNCTVFNVTPSLSSMVVNKYKLRDDIASYNLTGLGCTAGLLAISLAKQLLQVHRNTYALVVSTETITQNFYKGNDLSMILVNVAFRLGAAAILLSNHPSDQHSSKYQLIHTVRNNTASSDLSYGSIFQQEDQEGSIGVIVTRDLVASAINTIRLNIKSLGLKVLPISEKIRLILKFIAMNLNLIESKPLVPDFTKAFDHILPHVGAKPVLDGLERTLKLPGVYMEPSRMTLYRFGNTSSSSIWYELAYVEAKKRMKKGDRVWQMAFGSGFKCCSVVWRAIRTIDREEMNPWSDEINEFPVNLSKIESDTTFFKSPK